MALLPTEKLYIKNPAEANDEILDFAEALVLRGERPWVEVHYPKPEGVDQVFFDSLDADTFDAVEIIDGEIVTVAPYAELMAAEADA